MAKRILHCSDCPLSGVPIDDLCEQYCSSMADFIDEIRADVIEEVFRKIEERLNDNTTVTFDLPVEDVLGEDVDMDDFIMLAEKIVEEYKKLIFNKLKQAKKQLKGAENEDI